MTANADPWGTDNGQPLTLPAPQVPDPSTAPPLRWAVISPGHIADQFTAPAHRATNSRVVSVVSRSQQRADAFAGKHGIERAFSSVADIDRKSTRLNSSHVAISYAVFCLKKKMQKTISQAYI